MIGVSARDGAGSGGGGRDGVHTLRGWWRLAFIALVALRLVYISHDEVRASPHDSQAYIMQARAWYWGNDYSNWAYTRQPGYPLFIAIASMLGIPLRLAIEAAWLGAVVVTTRATALIGLRPSGRVLLAALLLFHPFTTELFTWVYADTLHGGAWLAYTMSLAAAAIAPTWRATLRWGWAAAIAGTIAANTRQESVLVYALAMATLGVVLGPASIAAWRQRVGPRRTVNESIDLSPAAGSDSTPMHAGREAPRVPESMQQGPQPARQSLPWTHRLTAACVLPVIIVFASEQAVKSANHARIGAYVGYDWSMPGFKALYQTMLSIPPESEHRPRVPIPREVRERAADVSATFASILPELETGDSCRLFRSAGESITKTPGEPGSFNLWSMREAIWTVHGAAIRSAADYDAICWRIVRELRAAQDAGRLAKRWAPLAFIPPEWTGLLREMPRSLETCWGFMSRINFTRGEPYPVEPRAVRGFNEMALRRGALMELHRPPREGLVDEKGPWQHRATVARLDVVKRWIGARWIIVSWLMLGATALGWTAAIATWRRERTRPTTRATPANDSAHASDNSLDPAPDPRIAPQAWRTMASIVLASLAMRLLLAMTLEATGVAASHRYLFPSAAMLTVAGITGLRGVVTAITPHREPQHPRA